VVILVDLIVRIYQITVKMAPFGVSAKNHARLAVAYGLIFASHKLFDNGSRPSAGIPRAAMW